MYFRNTLILTTILLWIYGCGQDTPFVGESTTPLEIGFQLAPDAPAQSNITRIDLTVSSPDLDEPRFFPITNINQSARTATGFIEIPVSESVTFSVKAFEGECPALSGLLENTEIAPDRAAPIIIRLSAIQIAVGVRSTQTQLSVGSRYGVEVYVEDAPRLTAFTCVLGFDEDLLEPLEAVPGDFFGTDALFIEDSEFQRRLGNRLSLGIALKGDVTGVCGSGVVFHVTFRARASGNAEIAVLENVTLTATGFEQIEDSSRVRRESGLFIGIE